MVFRGLAGLLKGNPEEQPASPRKTLSFLTLLLRFTFYF